MSEEKNLIKELIETSNNIAVIPSQIAGIDAFAAALGLFTFLKDSNKNVTFVYPDSVPEGFDDLISQKELMSDPSLRDLTVTINYHESPASTVKYSTANDVLTLKISPVTSDFKLSNIQSKIEEAGFDLIFTIGAQVKEDLGISYTKLQNEFNKAKVVNLDHTGMNTKYGDVNIVDPLMDSLSLLVMHLLVRGGYFISQKVAKALLRGISYRVVN